MAIEKCMRRLCGPIRSGSLRQCMTKCWPDHKHDDDHDLGLCWYHMHSIWYSTNAVLLSPSWFWACPCPQWPGLGRHAGALGWGFHDAAHLQSIAESSSRDIPSAYHHCPVWCWDRAEHSRLRDVRSVTRAPSWNAHPIGDAMIVPVEPRNNE